MKPKLKLNSKNIARIMASEVNHLDRGDFSLLESAAETKGSKSAYHFAEEAIKRWTITRFGKSKWRVMLCKMWKKPWGELKQIITRKDVEIIVLNAVARALGDENPRPHHFLLSEQKRIQKAKRLHSVLHGHPAPASPDFGPIQAIRAEIRRLESITEDRKRAEEAAFKDQSQLMQIGITPETALLLEQALEKLRYGRARRRKIDGFSLRYLRPINEIISKACSAIIESNTASRSWGDLDFMRTNAPENHEVKMANSLRWIVKQMEVIASESSRERVARLLSAAGLGAIYKIEPASDRA